MEVRSRAVQLKSSQFSDWQRVYWQGPTPKYPLKVERNVKGVLKKDNGNIEYEKPLLN